MERLQAVAREELRYVYLGNVPEADRDTRCGYCGATLVSRQAAVVTALREDGACKVCGTPSPILTGR